MVLFIFFTFSIFVLFKRDAMQFSAVLSDWGRIIKWIYLGCEEEGGGKVNTERIIHRGGVSWGSHIDCFGFLAVGKKR